MATSPFWLLAFSSVVSVFTMINFCWAYRNRLLVLYISYGISACVSIALAVLSVFFTFTRFAHLGPPIGALVCLFVGANPLIQAVHLNHAMNRGFNLRTLFEDLYMRPFIENFPLQFWQYVSVFAYASIAVALGQLVGIFMIAFSYKSGGMSEMIYFEALVEYLILALMLLKWTFPVLGWEALSNHFGCFIFAASELLTLAILLSLYDGTETHSICLWAGLPLTSVIQIWLSVVHKTHSLIQLEQGSR